jgi:hypothetical protein
VAERFSQEGLQIVGVSLDNDRSELVNCIAEQGLTWSHIFSGKPAHAGWENPIAKYFGIESIPQVFLLDQEGKIRATGLRSEAELGEAVAQLMMQEAGQ